MACFCTLGLNLIDHLFSLTPVLWKWGNWGYLKREGTWKLTCSTLAKSHANLTSKAWWAHFTDEETEGSKVADVSKATQQVRNWTKIWALDPLTPKHMLLPLHPVRCAGQDIPNKWCSTLACRTWGPRQPVGGYSTGFPHFNAMLTVTLKKFSSPALPSPGQEVPPKVWLHSLVLWSAVLALWKGSANSSHL